VKIAVPAPGYYARDGTVLVEVKVGDVAGQCNGEQVV